jgi:hypothetical protein
MVETRAAHLRRRRRQSFVGAVVVTSVVLAMSVVGDAPARLRSGTTWYVSRNGDGTVGTSWSTAWTEPSKVNWAEVNPGDRIVIDGGATRCPSNYPYGATTVVPPGRTCGMQYRGPFVIGASGVVGAPITISLSTSAGHDGTAVLAGGRTTPLPYCDQPSYRAVGHARAAGILIPGSSHVVIDGTHRSGIMVYGAQSGVDLSSDRTSFVQLRNLEVFDNGVYARWAHGSRTDGEGISLAGHDIVIDRDLIHDNGQDAIQDRDTGVPGIGHAGLHDITVTNSWLYERRDSPLFPGYGFNAGAQAMPDQDCTHVDGLQIWGGGLHQQRMTFRYDIFGPLLAQGVYPGDDDRASFDHVVIADSLFLNPLDHAIIGPGISADPSTPRAWHINRVTSYQTPRPNYGLAVHGKLDLAGSGHVLTNSLFYNGYFDARSIRGRGNLWWGGEPVAHGRRHLADFADAWRTGRSPTYSTLVALNLAPRCRACAGVGSSLHDVPDLLQRIDALDRKEPR